MYQDYSTVPGCIHRTTKRRALASCAVRHVLFGVKRPVLAPSLHTYPAMRVMPSLEKAQHQPHKYQQQEQRHNGEQQGQRPLQHYQQQQRGPTAGASSSSQAAGTVEAAAARDDPPPLPYGWGELRTGDGRPYYVYYPEGTVQWERPAPPKDPENDQQRAPQSAEREQQPSPAEATGRDDDGAGVAGESDRELEIGGSNGGAAQGCVEEDTSIPVGEVRTSSPFHVGCDCGCDAARFFTRLGSWLCDCFVVCSPALTTDLVCTDYPISKSNSAIRAYRDEKSSLLKSNAWVHFLCRGSSVAAASRDRSQKCPMRKGPRETWTAMAMTWGFSLKAHER